MATKKAAKKASVRRTNSKPVTEPSVHLPNGYKTIGRAPAWDAEKHPIIEGERGEAREVTMDEGKKNERVLRVCTVVDETAGAVSVWESAGTRPLFDETKAGDIVRVEYLGLGPKVKGKNQMRRFALAVKS